MIPIEERSPRWDLDRRHQRRRGRRRPDRARRDVLARRPRARGAARARRRRRGRRLAIERDPAPRAPTEPVTAAPVSTYRLQLTAEFTLHDAAALAGLPARPRCRLVLPLPAAAGRRRLDARVRRRRSQQGGCGARRRRTGCARSAAAAASAGLGVLVDIVPNHMGVGDPAANAWWWSVLELGSAHSPCADWFDIDWDAGRRHGCSIGELSRRRPPDSVTHYELIDWRRADTDLELPPVLRGDRLAAHPGRAADVFAATHELIVRGCAASARASTACASTTRTGSPIPAATSTPSPRRPAAPIVLVEKILAARRAACRRTGRPPAPPATTRSPSSTACFVDPAGQRPVDGTRCVAAPGGSARLGGPHPRHHARGRRRHPERPRCAVSRGTLRRASDPRSSTRSPNCSPASRSTAATSRYGAEHLEAAVGGRGTPSPRPRPPLEHVARPLGDPAHPAAIRFQQTSGMVMAKGVEDTAFYRDSRLASLTEVGGDPDEFAMTVDEFHAAPGGAARRAPDGHDDAHHPRHEARRRHPRAHQRARRAARRVGRVPRAAASAHALGDGALENLLWQSIVGAGRASARRCTSTPIKAAREAGGRTTWADPDDRFRGSAARAWSTPRSTTRRSPPTSRRSSARITAPRLVERARRQAAAADRTRRARRLPGQRAVGLLARRPRQPAPRRLRPAPPDAGRPRSGACRRSTRRALPSCSSHPEPCVPVVTGRSCSPATPRCPRPAPPPATSSPPTAAARSPSRPVSRSGCPPPAAGAARRSRCRTARSATLSRASGSRAACPPPTCSPGTRSRCCSATDRSPNIT